LSALLVVYREVLAIPIGDLRRVLRSNAPSHQPAVLSRGRSGVRSPADRLGAG